MPLDLEAIIEGERQLAKSDHVASKLSHDKQTLTSYLNTPGISAFTSTSIQEKLRKVDHALAELEASASQLQAKLS